MNRIDELLARLEAVEHNWLNSESYEEATVWRNQIECVNRELDRQFLESLDSE